MAVAEEVAVEVAVVAEEAEAELRIPHSKARLVRRADICLDFLHGTVKHVHTISGSVHVKHMSSQRRRRAIVGGTGNSSRRKYALFAFSVLSRNYIR